MMIKHRRQIQMLPFQPRKGHGINSGFWTAIANALPATLALVQGNLTKEREANVLASSTNKS